MYKECNIAMIRIRETFIMYKMHRNPAKYWRLSLFRYETFITFLTFWLSTREERERQTQFLLCWLFVQRQLSTHWPYKRARIPQQTTGLASPRFESQLASSSLKSQLTAFFQNTPESKPIASEHDVIHIPSPISYPGFLLWHLWLSHPPSSSVNTCAQCVPLPMH